MVVLKNFEKYLESENIKYEKKDLDVLIGSINESSFKRDKRKNLYKICYWALKFDNNWTSIINYDAFYDNLKFLFKIKILTIKQVYTLFKINLNKSLHFLRNYCKNAKEKKSNLDLIDFDKSFNLFFDIKSTFSWTSLRFDSIKYRKTDLNKEISDSNSIFIDGYSLIIDCLLNHHLDLHSGGQYLHLVYLFERYIEIIFHLTEHFFIIFFQDFNKILINDKYLGLAISILLNHLHLIDNLKVKIKFFDNFFSENYINFINEQKPTFLLVSDLNRFKKLKLRKSNKSNIELIYEIYLLEHFKFEMKIALIDGMTIESNRLHAFYSLYGKSNWEIYSQASQQISKTEVLAILSKSNSNYEQDIKFFSDFIKIKNMENYLKEFKSQMGDKLTLYSIALVYCFLKKDKNVENNDFLKFLLLIITNFYLCKNLDLEQRAIRLKRKKKYIKSGLKELLSLFQNSIAFIIQSSVFKFFKLEPKTLSDMFDGRLFSLSYLLAQTKGYEQLWHNLFSNGLYECVGLCFRAVTKLLSFYNIQFSLNIENLELNSKEIYCIFETVFKNKIYTQKEIESKCFKINKKEDYYLKLNTIEHPMIKNLINHLEIKDNLQKIAESEVHEKINDLMESNKWLNNHIINKTKIKSYKKEPSNKLIDELNIYSIEMENLINNQKKIDFTVNHQKEIENYIKNKNDLKADYFNKFKESDKLNYFYLIYSFENFQHKFKKNKQTDFNQEITDLLIKTDQVWRKIVLNDSVDKNLLSLIIEILCYFKFSKIIEKVLSFVEQKWNLEVLIPNNQKKAIQLSLSENRFQLKYLSDYLIKEKKIINDKRTNLFIPDQWQVEFLDAIDKNDSMLIIAPTSSGKTYASFYAMEKIIKSKDNSILVYVSPTKALVNQVCFSIMKKFGHIKLNKGQDLCGVFTRDFRNSITSCKILVTVPQCLLILMINYYNTNWPSNIKYVILDEIHSIGSDKNSRIWEQLFLLIKSPFIALSATIGKPDIFHKWLTDLENYKSKQLGLNRQVKLIYHKETVRDLKRYLYTTNGLKKINPIGFLNHENFLKHKHLPDDLNLLPSETLELYDEMKKNNINDLEPDKYLLFDTNLNISLFFTRNSVDKYQNELKQNLTNFLLKNKNTDFFSNFHKLNEDEVYPTYKSVENKKYLIELVSDLYKNNMLPAILFSNNRILCERHVKSIIKSISLKFDNSLYDEKADELIRSIKQKRLFDKMFFDMIEKGVAWHHSGLLPDQKSFIEALFRLGKIKILLATSTLAQGIHVPCRTAVFIQDEIFLDTFQYKQASGRAGRRGFDQTGNVVFFNIPFKKVERLVASYVPELRPHFPVSITFTMQIFNAVLKSRKSSNLSIDCVLNKSYWNFVYKNINKQVKFDSMFSLNFLYDINLLNKDGNFSKFSDLIERIHYHEPSNYLFYYLLVNNVFDEVLEYNLEQDIESVFLIICHLFNNIHLRKTDQIDQILPNMNSKVVNKIKEYNDYVMKIYTEYFSFLCQTLKEQNKEENFSCLELSKLSFKKQNNLDNFIQKWTYKPNSTSPFSSLSGLKDNGVFKCQKYLYLNVLKYLHIDSSILPVVKYDAILSDYAYKFFVSPDLNKCINELNSKEYGISFSDLFHNLKDFKILLNSIFLTIKEIVPKDDPIRILFDELSYQFEHRFYEATEIISDF